MKRYRLDDMTRGWFVGAFEPTALATDAAEAGVKRYAAGAREAAHVHKIATEITVILSGIAEMNGRRLTEGDIVVLAPGEAADFHAVTDVVTVVVKTPCAPGDKHPAPTLNIVVPMAGRGRRFAEQGYASPKPLIPVCGRPMIELVVDNLRPSRPHRFIFLCLREHLEHYGLAAELARWAPGCVVRPVDQVTEGAACTVLLARDLIDGPAPLMIANCDQWIDADIDAYLARLDEPDVDGLIMTMAADRDPKWSFVACGPDGMVERVAEKEPISNIATVGVYNFARGGDFVAAAGAMIAADMRVNGEFYVAPAYNMMLAAGARVARHDIGA
ncbi:MAG TPA: glycosyltransferase family 2 protein, partial [Azospirillaceae bacterium]|nr:glycosyltransferase family 2 protein [Azospirillaceae bacterium]